MTGLDGSAPSAGHYTGHYALQAVSEARDLVRLIRSAL